MEQISWQHQNDEAAAAAAMVEESGPPPFLMKIFEMVDDLSTADIVYWNRGGHSFVVWDHNAFSTTLLPAYFKHNNFSSFVRQLNTYGFRKIDAEKWEFANEAFVRGKKHLLKNIRRRRSPTHHSPSPHPADVGPCVELGWFGQEAEVDRLRRDKQVLMTELVKLRQQNQNIRLHLQQVESGVHGTEKKQKKMMRFLVNAMQNPDIIRQLVRHKEMNKGSRSGETNRNDKELNLLKVGHDGECGFEVSELEALAMQMQGMGKAKMEERSRDHRKIEQSDKEVVDEGFWGEMLNQGFNEAERLMGKNGEGEEEDDHVNVLANRFGFLGSTSSSNIS